MKMMLMMKMNLNFLGTADNLVCMKDDNCTGPAFCTMHSAHKDGRFS